MKVYGPFGELSLHLEEGLEVGDHLGMHTDEALGSRLPAAQPTLSTHRPSRRPKRWQTPPHDHLIHLMPRVNWTSPYSGIY
jgi:hypothetical protein